MQTMAHVSAGTRDVVAAGAFYDAVLSPLGIKRTMEYLPFAIAYGVDQPEFWVQLPFDQTPATPGNGVHFCFRAESAAAVAPFTPLQLPQAAAMMARRGFAPTTRPTITRPLYAISMATSSKQCASSRREAGAGQGLSLAECLRFKFAMQVRVVRRQRAFRKQLLRGLGERAIGSAAQHTAK